MNTVAVPIGAALAVENWAQGDRGEAGAIPATPTPPATPLAGGVRGARVALAGVVVAWVAMVGAVALRLADRSGDAGGGTLAVALGYLGIVTVLAFASVMHLTARLGAAHRFANHVPTPLAQVRRHFAADQPTMTVLIPSYREETEVIRRTVLSAALQEYRDLRIVLLIDDPPSVPAGSVEAAQLDRARLVPQEVAAQLAVPHRRALQSFADFEERVRGLGAVGSFEARLAASELHAASATLAGWAVPWAGGDHADRFFGADVLGALGRDLCAEADRLIDLSRSDALPVTEIRAAYRRLVDIFDARLTSFERKRYASLSHEPNKAMNLNAYLGLMGRSFVEVEEPDGIVLTSHAAGLDGCAGTPDDGGAVASPSSCRHVPDSDYVLTLDADSVLLPGYAARLVHLLEQPENASVGVAQTPYSAFPNPATQLERIAGATTDMQYVLHQGMTHYGATFWVGANAVLRKRAIDDIVVTSVEEGREVHRFIQDRTVIEDTESSLDLLLREWTLVNYPERLAYSATPPDFGSLIIQRRRWANGGLIILPNLGRLLRGRRRRRERSPLAGTMLQFHYLTSMPATSLALLSMLALPAAALDGLVPTGLVPLLMAPYLMVLVADLPRCGYRAADVLRVYALNLLLVPVNLAGAFRSLQQAATGRKAPFIRTPKVKDRVAAPASYVVLPAVAGALGLVAAVASMAERPGLLPALAAATALLTLYGVVVLVGARNAWEDVVAGVRMRLSQSAQR